MIDPCKVPWGNKMLFSSPIAIQKMYDISKN